MTGKNMKSFLANFIILNIGCLIAAAVAALLFSKAELPPGGMISIAMMLARFININVGDLAFYLNIPLLVLGFVYFGFEYLSKVFYASLAYPFFVSILTRVFADFIATSNINFWFAIVVGGLLQGLGVALTVYSGANTGGTDILAQVLNKHLPKLSLGTCMAIFNYSIMGVSMIVLGAGRTFGGVIIIFLTVTSLDFFLKMLNKKGATN